MASFNSLDTDRYASTTSKQYAIRVCLLGEAGAGKSTLFHRIKYKSYRDSTEDGDRGHTLTSSVGTSRNRSYDSHTVVLRPNRRTKINLTIVDTASRERYQSLTAQYYRRTNVILMVCSLDSEYTLTRLAKWHQEAQYYIDDSEVIYAVVGTKCDLSEAQREVSSEMLVQFATHYAISRRCVFEVSSRTGGGVDNMLESLCEAVIEQFERQPGFAAHGDSINSSEQSSLLTTTRTNRRSGGSVDTSLNRVEVQRSCFSEECTKCCSCFSKGNSQCTIL